MCRRTSNPDANGPTTTMTCGKLPSWLAQTAITTLTETLQSSAHLATHGISTSTEHQAAPIPHPSSGQQTRAESAANAIACAFITSPRRRADEPHRRDQYRSLGSDNGLHPPADVRSAQTPTHQAHGTRRARD